MKPLRLAPLILLVFMLSCEKTIEFSPRNPEPKLVVDATIETGTLPIVFLSRSLGYFNRISLDQLAGSLVRGAEVTLSNGTTTLPLQEFEIPVSDTQSLYYYSFDSLDQSAYFRGVDGETYTLTIKVGNEEFSATSTIPEGGRTLDSMYVETNVDPEDSSKVVLYGTFTDPPGLGQFSRYYTSVNSNPFFPGLNSVLDDQVIDGKTFTVQVEQGVDRNSEIDFEEYSYFKKGDYVVVKFCNIDKGVFDFWRTMEYSYSSIGNPFSSPTRVKGNISNGALGYFGGYAVKYATINIPE